MSATEVNSQSLREKLTILGYTQSVPVSAVPIVGILLEDLIKTTESLRNAKLEVAKYLEEKSCWELGIEPYKCDNSRLLSECNSLHLELIKQKDEYEEKICDYRQTIRNLEADKQHLEEHCAQLEKNVRELLMKVSGGSKSSKNDVNMSRKPFISTVKSGRYVTNPSDVQNAYRCAKCSSIVWTKHLEGKVQEVQLMHNGLQSQADQIAWLKDKLERREREINRLNELLSGGRPAEALARDCCYKNVGTLSEDVEDLQKEKSELLRKYRDAQDSMHEAMQRAINLEEKNKHLERELEEFQKEALGVESEANAEIFKKENEISALKKELEKLKGYQEKDCGKSIDDKRKLYEQLNSLTQKEKELVSEVERMKKKNSKLKGKIATLQKTTATNDNASLNLNAAEDEIKRYRNERDFFQKEYLKMVEQSASSKEVEALKLQLEDKTNEVKALAKELLQARYRSGQDESRPSSCHSVQATIMRVERERDVLKEEIRLLRMERGRLRDKLDNVAESQASDRCRIEEENRMLQSRLCKLESEKRELMAAHIPERTQLCLVKEELEEMRKRVQELQTENHKLSTTNNQLRILQDQTEKALIDHQNKLLAAETNLENAEYKLSLVNTSRETAGKETHSLQKEIAILKSNNSTLEAEKDKILSELDTKTETVFQLENDLKTIAKQKQDLQCKVKMLERKLGATASQKQEYETELHENSTESKTLREQIYSLKLSRDQTLAENCRITNDLAETTAEARQVKQKLKESEKEVDKLKQQLQQYVQEVKRAEELLMLKEQEREEMLEHYRSLSHDAVLLEGNNQSLENEAAEQRQLLCDAQTEVDNLKKELMAKSECISKFENQVSLLSSQITECQAELEQNYDELRLVKVDLDASKDLINKLDVERDRLNAELEESKSVRCQLENELKDLRENMMNIHPDERMQITSLEDLLHTSRKELEHQKKKNCQLNQEISALKKRIHDLEDKYSCERQKSIQNETLAREYSVKIQELQQTLTNSRFEQSRAQECSPSKVRFVAQPNPSVASNETYETRATAGSISPKASNKSSLKSPSSAFASSLKAITKTFTPDEKKALEQDIKDFLTSGKSLQDGVHEYEENVSLDEDNSNIIVRRRRTIKTKTSSSARKAKADSEQFRAGSHSLPSSPSKLTPSKDVRSIPKSRKSECRETSRTSLKSRSLSPTSFPDTRRGRAGLSKEPRTNQASESYQSKQFTSDPETDYSKSLHMKTNHRFNGSLDFSTAVQLKMSPRKKEQKHTIQESNKSKNSGTNVFFMRGKNEERHTGGKCSSESRPHRKIDSNASSADNSSYPLPRLISGVESKESDYPKSSTTDTLPSYYPTDRKISLEEKKPAEAKETVHVIDSIIPLPANAPQIEIIDLPANSESKYYTVAQEEDEQPIAFEIDVVENSSREPKFSSKDMVCPRPPKPGPKEPTCSKDGCSSATYANPESPTPRDSQYTDNQISNADTSAGSPKMPVPESSTGCSCMQNRKMQILASFNVSVDQAEPQYTTKNMYYRTYKMCRSPNGYDTESSSGFERSSTRKRLPKPKQKKIDLSKLPPPPPLHRKTN